MATPLPPHSQEETAKAREEAKVLLNNAPYAALAYLEQNTTHPAIGRVAISLIEGELITLISDLSAHTMGLKANGAAALMLGEIGKGDGLASPRLSLTVHAEPMAVSQRPALTEMFLKTHPKAKLYTHFGDFNFYRFEIIKAAYYGGFGRAHNFTAVDLMG